MNVLLNVLRLVQRPDLGIVGSVLPAEMLLIIQQSRGRAEEMHLERLNANWNKKLFALAEDVLGCSTAAPKRTTRGKGPSLQKSTQLSYMEAFQVRYFMIVGLHL